MSKNFAKEIRRITKEGVFHKKEEEKKGQERRKQIEKTLKERRVPIETSEIFKNIKAEIRKDAKMGENHSSYNVYLDWPEGEATALNREIKNDAAAAVAKLLCEEGIKAGVDIRCEHKTPGSSEFFSSHNEYSCWIHVQW